MNFFHPRFVSSPSRPPQPLALFNPGEVAWVEQHQTYSIAGPALVCYLLHQAFVKDSGLTAAQQRVHRACIWSGVALAEEHGFANGPQLMQLLLPGTPDPCALRTLTDQLLTHLTPDQFLQCVLGAKLALSSPCPQRLAE